MADDFGVFDEAFAEDIVSLAFAIGITNECLLFATFGNG